MRVRFPSLVLSVLAAAAALSSLGCGGGLDFDNDSFPAPFVGLAESPATCQSAGSGQILFDLADVRVSENFRPTDPANRVDVSGTVSGIGDMDQLALIVYPAGALCPILSATAATVDGSNFTARGDFGDRDEFRFVLVAHSGVLDDLDCDDASGCFLTAAGSFTAVSHAIEVRLTD